MNILRRIAHREEGDSASLAKPAFEEGSLSLRVVTWNVGTCSDRAIAQVFAKTKKHPESFSLQEPWPEDVEEIYAQSRTAAYATTREKMVVDRFTEMGDLDIIFIQEAYDFEELDSLLLGNYGISEKTKTANTRVLWNQERFTLLGAIDVGDDAGVQLQESKTGLVINAVSGHIGGFALRNEIPMMRQDMVGGNEQLTRIVSQCQTKPAHVTMLGMDVNCPLISKEDKGYSQLDRSHRAVYLERHKILEKGGFSTLPPLYPTNINRHYGEIPLDYIYFRSTPDLLIDQEAVEKPQGLKWKNSPSDHMPVINTFVIQHS